MRFVHANALIVDGQGILIRGASKSGKSTLTLALINAARARGKAALLIGDDRIGLSVENGALIARGHPRIVGLIEVRGSGIETHDFAELAKITLLIDLGEAESEGEILLEGVRLRHICLIPRGNQEKMLQCITRVLK